MTLAGDVDRPTVVVVAVVVVVPVVVLGEVPYVPLQSISRSSPVVPGSPHG